MDEAEALKWLEAWLKSRGTNACVSFGWNPKVKRFAVIYMAKLKAAKASNGTLTEMINEFREEVERNQGH